MYMSSGLRFRVMGIRALYRGQKSQRQGILDMHTLTEYSTPLSQSMSSVKRINVPAALNRSLGSTDQLSVMISM